VTSTLKNEKKITNLYLDTPMNTLLTWTKIEAGLLDHSTQEFGRSSQDVVVFGHVKKVGLVVVVG
jgi:hypothetical protein